VGNGPVGWPEEVAMAEPVLLVHNADGIATLTLNRPAAMNALSRELRGEITQAFETLRSDPGVGVVILTGRGRAFCAGLDLKELAGAAPGGEAPAGAAPRSEGTREMLGQADMIGSLLAFDRPIIGAVNGFAITGGFELALACDLLVASTQARFADTHARVGILPGWGLSQRLPRIIGPGRAKELSFTGNFLDAETASAWGLVNRVVEPEALLDTCRSLARDMLSCDRASLLGIKRLYDDGLATTLGEGLELERRTSSQHVRGVRPDQIAARREKIQRRGRAQSGS
jgi:enoyl-CoA hydratase